MESERWATCLKSLIPSLILHLRLFSQPRPGGPSCDLQANSLRATQPLRLESYISEQKPPGSTGFTPGPLANVCVCQIKSKLVDRVYSLADVIAGVAKC